MTSRPLRVLIVEDSDNDARLLERALRQGGYDLTSRRVDTPDDLKQALRAQAWDVILSDHSMPRFSALDALGIATELQLDLPFLVVSGSIGEDTAVRMMKAGAHDYIMKDNLVRLLPAIDRELREAASRRQRRRSEEALRASEERYRLLFETSPVAMWVYATETSRCLAVNEAAVRQYGYSREEFLAMSGGEQALAGDRVADAPRADDQVSMETACRHRRKDGTIVDVEVSSHALSFDGTPAQLVLATDVTARRQAEARLAGRERQQAALAELGRHGLESGDSVALAQHAASLVAKQLGADVVDVFELLPDERSLKFHATVGRPGGQALVETVVPIGHRTARRTPWRSWQPTVVADLRQERRFAGARLLAGEGLVSAVIVPVHGHERRFGVLAVYSRSRRHFEADEVHFAHSVANVLAAAIERRRNEDMLRVTEEQLRQSQKMEAVGRLAGGIAHDFNNLLTAILGFADLMYEQLDPRDPFRQDVAEIKKAGDRAAALTRQLLAFSRRQVLEPQVVHLSDVVHALEPMLRRLIGEHIDLRIDAPATLGRTLADPGQIEQVIMNLIVNARDAMPDGGVLTLETSDVTLTGSDVARHLAVEAGDYVMLAVTDTGHGMSAEVRAHLFEPFFTTKRTGEGTGLGLSTVYGIVKQSGGHIWVHSEVGCGSTFKIYLPRVAQAAAVPSEPAAPRPRGGTETILLVEDEEGVRRLVRRVLQRRGYTVLEASGGEEALRLGEGQRIDLLITDVVMPQMSGRILADRIGTRYPAVKVLFISGYTDDAVINQGVVEHGTAFLQKPFSGASLAAKVREILDTAHP